MEKSFLLISMARTHVCYISRISLEALFQLLSMFWHVPPIEPLNEMSHARELGTLRKRDSLELVLALIRRTIFVKNHVQGEESFMNT